MRLDDEQASSNVEDRRGQRGRRGGFRIPMGRRGGGGIGIGTIVILGIMWLVFGVNPLEMLGGGGLQQQTQQVPQTQQQQGAPAANDEMGKFASKVLSTTERTWARIFKENNRQYQEPRMVLFSGYVQSACGAAQSAMGPFYCPRDKKIYIDLSFFRDMSTRLGASGDFAHAYVIAHEVGHHVQTLLGIAEKVTAARLRSSKTEANRLSVRMELQADCLAGVWARDNKNILEQGDIEEGINAATAIGDDRLQKRSQGYVVPESFTHGTSAQRVEWFKRGIQTGDIRQCDTFG
ncbi:KPN_02809 family neutral zinc metallopeptidase [Anderseniella sp. Alg231-50]|uniref:KPN_02809 family neutral zinc metallopeptidase n=1 Tax=Anderseniella sp. Alg231-50 TaxID=1922226 RepID=UPI000D552DD6